MPSMNTPKDLKTVVADNLARAIEGRWTYPAFAKEAKTDAKTIWDLINPDRSPKQPTLRTLGKVAKTLKCELWQLLYEDMPTELLGSKKLRELISLFAQVSEETREQILNLARERAEIERLRKENELLKGR